MENNLDFVMGGKMEGEPSLEELKSTLQGVQEQKDWIDQKIQMFGIEATGEGTRDAMEQLLGDKNKLQQEWIALTDMIKDVEAGRTMSKEEFERISNEMREIAAKNSPEEIEHNKAA